MGGGMGGAIGGGEENTNFEKSEKDTLMIRSLDFTVEPDTIYRFRLRVVVFNPNFSRQDVSPGVDTKSTVLNGPWSEPTREVAMPADVATYAMSKTRAGTNNRTDQVQFQVVRWSPEDGVTVNRSFDAGPGEVIGSPLSTQIPHAEGEKAKSRIIDYNSHHIVVDTTGGLQPIAQVGAGGAPLDVPALTILMRPDGLIAIRDETQDLPDPVRKDMEETYKREREEAGKERKSSMGSGMMGMMGGMMMGGSGRRPGR
jgi:hypothetical protein